MQMSRPCSDFSHSDLRMVYYFLSPCFSVRTSSFPDSKVLFCNVLAMVLNLDSSINRNITYINSSCILNLLL